ncbi:MAG TPA: efflux RND transporter periplasmic adaptor subunit [Terracidiphilus sp.]|nr:efflux RND transporter periplasmic adaptor subunit [Terracidiphilus sp.]
MKRRRILIAAGIAAVCLVILGIVLFLSHRPSNEYYGTIETREIQIGSKVGGRVIAVPVEEGQRVKAGQVLVRFESDELTAQRQEAAAKVTAAEAELDRLLRGNRPEEIAEAEAAAAAQKATLEAAVHGPRPQELAQAKADYDAAKADAANAESYYKRMAELAAKDIISRQQFDDARDKRDSTAQRAEAARQRLALLQAGTRAEDIRAAKERYAQLEAKATLARRGARKEDIEAARARLAQAQSLVTELDARLREAVLTVPSDALVEVVSVRPGDLVSPGRIVMNLLEPSQLWVKVYIPETSLSRVHIGQTAAVRVDSFPGRTFSGQLKQIDAQAEFLPRNVQTSSDREHQVFGAKVYVDNTRGVLKSGMTATVRLQ